MKTTLILIGATLFVSGITGAGMGIAPYVAMVSLMAGAVVLVVALEKK